MTKRWVFKIDTPWGKKGDRAILELDKQMRPKYIFSDYPDLFELVEEKSDEEKLVDWLSGHYYRAWPPDDNLVAKQLIAAGLDVNKLGVE